MQVLITLNEPLGLDLGPFNITANVGTVSPSTASREDLISGIIATVDDSATQITVTSNGFSACPNTALILNIGGLPEPPPLPYNTFYLSSPRSVNDTDNSGCNDIFDYCIAPGYNIVSPVYANTNDPTTPSLLNKILYLDTNLTIPFVGMGTGFRYAVSNINGINTFNSPTLYNLIEVTSDGYVNTVEVNICDCDSNGIPI